ncbi:helicase-related protein [Actinomyces timonensis]|uniref:Helicase-related protein n=1 Tax=Actinomyces timonensis TaxID=1288391 RepID=A0AAU8N399_9ACTO
MEVGLQSTYGRTLEATGSLAVHVDAGQSADLIRIARAALSGDGAPDALPGLGPLTEADLLAWVRGTVERMRRDGAIDHEWLRRYKEEDGRRLWIWYKRRRDQGQPAFPAGRSAPSFPQVKGNINTRHSAFTPVVSPKSWYATWARACLGVTGSHAARLAALLLARLAEADVLSTTRTTSGGTVYGIPAHRVLLTPLPDGSEEELLLVCDTCRSQLPAARATVGQLAGAPCLVARCPGRLAATRHPADSFYRGMYTATHVRRVDAHEHTSLLDADKRAAVEQGFKRPTQQPGDPNVLVATPTLEMGIDIGDLSTVMLGSLPDTVASYVQRVGRAGRRSGSALALAYVRGRPNQIRLLEDPARLLDGAVAPPSTYLGAEAILRRQFLAYVIDTLTREGHPAVPGGGRGRADARTVFDTRGQGTFLAAVTERIARDGAPLAAAFTATFADRAPALKRLAAWASGDGGAGPRLMIECAAEEHRAEAEQLRHQDEQIKAALPELIAAKDRPNATEEDKRAWRAAESARKAITARLIDLENEPWIAALERHGVLPNYALIDDTVRLSARVSWRDPETDEFTTEPYDLDRASTHALHELRPRRRLLHPRHGDAHRRGGLLRPGRAGALVADLCLLRLHPGRRPLRCAALRPEPVPALRGHEHRRRRAGSARPAPDPRVRRRRPGRCPDRRHPGRAGFHALRGPPSGRSRPHARPTAVEGGRHRIRPQPVPGTEPALAQQGPDPPRSDRRPDRWGPGARSRLPVVRGLRQARLQHRGLLSGRASRLVRAPHRSARARHPDRPHARPRHRGDRAHPSPGVRL